MAAFDFRLASYALLFGALHAIPAAAADARAPNFTLPRLGADGAFAFASVRGHVVLVDFWASWCAPCRHSLPAYDALYGELEPRGFDVVAINLDESEADANAFLATVTVRRP